LGAYLSGLDDLDLPAPLEAQRTVFSKRHDQYPASDNAQLPCRRKSAASIISARYWSRAEPLLAGFLDPGVRGLARARQKEYWDNVARGQAHFQRRDRHRESPYILKGIIRTKQGQYPMMGHTTMCGDRRYRSYVASRAICQPQPGTIFSQYFSAEPVERAVIAALQGVLTDASTVRDAILKHCQARATRGADSATRLSDLKSEQAKLQGRLRFALETLDEIGQDAARQLVAETQARLRGIDSELCEAQARRHPVADPGSLAERVMERLRKLSETMPTLPPKLVRGVLQAFVGRLEVDLETREIEVEFRLPSWAEADPDALCLDQVSAWKTEIQAQHVPLAMVRLCPVWRAYVPCDRCRRAA
jgi:hypothetical protein